MNKVRVRGFTAKKGELKDITETGKATVFRKVKSVNGVMPSVEECPLGKVGALIWWREHLRMHKSDATVTSKITSININEVNGKNVWVIETERVST